MPLTFNTTTTIGWHYRHFSRLHPKHGDPEWLKFSTKQRKSVMGLTSLTPANTDLNCQTRSLECVHQCDKQKCSPIILHKHIVHSLFHRLGAISPACTDRMREIGLWEMTFLPADCKNLYVTALKVGKRGEKEKIEIRPSAALFPSSIDVDISYQNVVLKMCHWHWGSEVDLNESDAFFFWLFRISKPNMNRPWYSV